MSTNGHRDQERLRIAPQAEPEHVKSYPPVVLFLSTTIALLLFALVVAPVVWLVVHIYRGMF